MSASPSASTSTKPQPLPIVSGSSFSPAAPFSCTKSSPAASVISVNRSIGISTCGRSRIVGTTRAVSTSSSAGGGCVAHQTAPAATVPTATTSTSDHLRATPITASSAGSSCSGLSGLDAWGVMVRLCETYKGERGAAGCIWVWVELDGKPFNACREYIFSLWLTGKVAFI